ncbi:hypothetical protein E2C01_070377 [Portunus trituberculatus]|uniref:Uncharacterized protein n=1 Tax=Portunus trituberculatus TaxID=210409 RepID=A0A5B7I1Y2_PORTR|nr:hypothetical protein [Portunus trituberculatus]
MTAWCRLRCGTYYYYISKVLGLECLAQGHDVFKFLGEAGLFPNLNFSGAMPPAVAVPNFKSPPPAVSGIFSALSSSGPQRFERGKAYVSSINARTPLTDVFNKVRRIAVKYSAPPPLVVVCSANGGRP